MTARYVDHIFARSANFNILLASIFNDRGMTRQALHIHGSANRLAWVDIAKGICIILVVMMHTTFGLEKATGETGWMHAVVAFSKREYRISWRAMLLIFEATCLNLGMGRHLVSNQTLFAHSSSLPYPRPTVRILEALSLI